MTYRLKDSALQKHLDAISNGDFSHRLQNELQDIRGNGTTDADYRIFFGFMSGRAELVNRFSMLLYEHEIEVIQEYNPNEWNAYPEVTPPEGVWMRVEAQRVSTGEISRVCAIFRDGRWHLTEQGSAFDLVEFAGTKKVKRYRPWEGAMVWHKWPDKKPPELIELLVTHKTEKGELRIDKACFDPDEGWEGIIDMVGDVLAWAELPEPYIPD